jgi:hypothetical protein
MVRSFEAGQAVGESCGPDRRARKRRGLPMGVKPMLSPGDVAEVYGISVRTVWRWLSAGQIPAPDLRVKKRSMWRQESIIPK